MAAFQSFKLQPLIKRSSALQVTARWPRRVWSGHLLRGPQSGGSNYEKNERLARRCSHKTAASGWIRLWRLPLIWVHLIGKFISKDSRHLIHDVVVKRRLWRSSHNDESSPAPRCETRKCRKHRNVEIAKNNMLKQRNVIVFETLFPLILMPAKPFINVGAAVTKNWRKHLVYST